MSVLENVLVASNLRMGVRFAPAVLHLTGSRSRERKARAEALELLAKVGLEAHSDDPATSLPYGMQRRLEIVRALATRQSLLLLDEPAADMKPQESLELLGFFRKIRDEFGIAILLIGLHMQGVMDVCERMYVLEYGRTIAEGTPAEIQKNQRVIDAYLGVD